MEEQNGMDEELVFKYSQECREWDVWQGDLYFARILNMDGEWNLDEVFRRVNGSECIQIGRKLNELNEIKTDR